MCEGVGAIISGTVRNKEHRAAVLSKSFQVCVILSRFGCASGLLWEEAFRSLQKSPLRGDVHVSVLALIGRALTWEMPSEVFTSLLLSEETYFPP
jgi:hypothetical protein